MKLKYIFIQALIILLSLTTISCKKNHGKREFETFKISIGKGWKIVYRDHLIKEEPKVTQSAIGFNRDSSYAKLNITSYYASAQIRNDLISLWKLNHEKNFDTIRNLNLSAFMAEKDLKVLDDVNNDTLTYFNSEWLLLGEQYIYKLSYGSYNKKLKEYKMGEIEDRVT